MQPTPDILIAGATILTADPARPVIDIGWIDIMADRITAICDTPPMHVAPTTRIIRAAGRVVTPGFVNVHTHAVLSMLRGVAENLGFAPAYAMGVPHGHDVLPEEAHALAQRGGLKALLFGSTLINDSCTHQDIALTAMQETGIRAWGCGRIHDVDFSRLHLGQWHCAAGVGDETLGLAVALADRIHDLLTLRTGACWLRMRLIPAARPFSGGCGNCAMRRACGSKRMCRKAGPK